MKNLKFKSIGKVFAFFMLTIPTQSIFSQSNILPENGNVGIGTTAPTEKLQVNGSARIDSTLIVKDSMIVHNDALIKDNMTVNGSVRIKDTSYFYAPIYYSNYTNLNTTQTGLKVFGTDETGLVKSFELSELLHSGDFLTCMPDANGDYSPNWNYGPNKIYTYCPNTRIGINTNNPTHNLHVIGNQLTEGSGQFKSFAINTTPSTFARMKIETGSYGAGIEIIGANSQYNKFLLFHSSNPTSEIIKVVNDQTGNVPFYLTAGGQMVVHNGTIKTLQLDTDGLLHTRKVRVDVQNWPDYVFDSSYVLMPLCDLQSYITKENHLPNVPSASKLEEGGSDLYEMSKLQMEKIEELTLYLLQQQREIEALKNKVTELERKND